jgi:hypothetical protein
MKALLAADATELTVSRGRGPLRLVIDRRHTLRTLMAKVSLRRDDPVTALSQFCKNPT